MSDFDLTTDKSETFPDRCVAKFWKKVDIKGPEECWPWTASIGKPGYGHVHVRPRHLDSHRMAYMFAKGSIEPGKQILHSCDNRLCCNPNHLRQGTPKQNHLDAMLLGGIKLKIDIEAVRVIAHSCIMTKAEEHEIAARFGVDRSYVRDIRNGRILRSVTGLERKRYRKKRRSAAELQAAKSSSSRKFDNKSLYK
jgi:hypothetical protein